MGDEVNDKQILIDDEDIDMVADDEMTPPPRCTSKRFPSR
jgi:hypothetical protein